MLRPRVAVGIWGALCLLAAFRGTWRGDGARSFAFALAGFAVLLAGAVWLAAPAIRDTLLRVRERKAAVLVALWPLGAYLLYALGAESLVPRYLATAVAYALVPVLLEASAPSDRAVAWQDYAALAAIVIPLRLGWLHDLFDDAPLHGTYAFTMLLAINVALAAFLLVRRKEGVGYSIGWQGHWGGVAALSFLLIAPIDITAGMAMNFMTFGSHAPQWYALPAVAVGTFIFTAWPEEFLFRGLLQNSLQRSLRNEYAGWIIASAAFGFAHIANGAFPNWRYVLLATVAGVFYGLAWRKTRSIYPGAIVHTAVDVAWHALFRTV